MSVGQVQYIHSLPAGNYENNEIKHEYVNANLSAVAIIFSEKSTELFCNAASVICVRISLLKPSNHSKKQKQTEEMRLLLKNPKQLGHVANISL